MTHLILSFLILINIPLLSAQTKLQTITNCKLIPTDWADGDSFQIQTPTGEKYTVRLYGADCLESNVTDRSDERRLREQRRYFGITKAKPTSQESIALAKKLGEKATQEVRKFTLRPFTIHTTFSDARGDGRYKRIYAFITDPDGKDLASHLVEKGLARAYGVSRMTKDGQSRDEYRETLSDYELKAAKLGAGAWAHTNWDTLPSERKQHRIEEAEAAIAMGKDSIREGFSLNPNTSPRDTIMRLKGIGESIANRIIENRPYQTAEDLLKVPGIGQKTLENMRPYLKF